MSAPAMSPAIPPVYVRRCAPITEGVVMSRTRVHNMNISLDGYAAGEHVTFDARSAAPSGCSSGSTAG